MKITPLITGDLLMLSRQSGESYSLKRQDNPDEFSRLAAMVRKNQLEEVWRELDPSTKILDATNGRIRLDPSKELILVADGSRFPKGLATKLREFIGAGINVDSLLKFWERLRRNPDTYVREQLFNHIARNGTYILKDGRFAMYKNVKDNMTSHHDGRTLHVVGKKVVLRRELCTNNPHETCASGLHAAPWKYVSQVYHYGTRIELFCDPEHAVSCPSTDSEKIRFCEYEVSRIMKPGDTPLLGIGEEKAMPKEVTLVPKLEARTKGKAGRVVEMAKNLLNKIAGRLPKEVVKFTTDRITVPGAIMTAAGFSPSEEVCVVLTDRRARFLYVVRAGRGDRDYEVNQSVIKNLEELGITKHVEKSKALKMTSTGALGVRNNLLALAQISSKPSRPAKYLTKVVKPGLVEVRLA